MKELKIRNWFNHMIEDFFAGIFRRRKKEKFRRVYIGLRLRMLGIFFLFMSFIILVLTLVMFMDQRRLVQEEKNEKATVLTKILGGPAEFYLDRDKTMKREELTIKYDTIVREAQNFKNYNEDIYRIFICDRDRKVVYSTDSKDIGKIYKDQPFVKNALDSKTEDLNYYDFKIKLKGKKAQHFRAITYPVFLKKGEVVQILSDFKKYYSAYNNADKKRKNEIYLTLYNRYKEKLKDLSPEEKTMTDVTKAVVTRKGAKKNVKPVKEQVEKSKGISKYGDIDFLFMKLFSEILDNRRWRLSPDEQWMTRESWLESLKKERQDALENDRVVDAGKAQQKIIDNMNLLYERIEDLRLLGTLSIIFNLDKMQADIDKNISNAAMIALIILAVAFIVSFFVVNFMVKNLKRLEKWALEVSNGNLDVRVEIKSKDEIGRLSDIFNNMLQEIKTKYHLEKFVSQSTRSMLSQKGEDVSLGQTGKRSLSFLFSDVRGFTSFSEKNPPETVIEILNLYFEVQAKIIYSKRGDIDDYTGDQIMCHFGGDKKADTAISTAIEIMRAINKINEDRKKKGLPYFEIGIGVHGGDVVVGNIGAGFRMDFCCIGDAVNLSSRLCAAAGPGEILVSKELFNQSSKRYPAKTIPPIEVKGKEKKIEVVSIKV